MKIVFDHQIFSNQKYGGISRYFVELAKSISKMSKHEARIKFIAPLYKNKYIANHEGKYKVAGLKFPDIPKTGRPIRAVNEFLSRFLVSKYCPDVIHETYYSKNYISLKNAKRIITVYDMIHERFPEHFSKNDETRVLKRHAVARADHVICISENTKNDLMSILGVENSKISVVHLGFQFSNIGNPSQTKGGKPFFLYVGPRNGYKNFKKLMMAYASSERLKTNIDVVCFGGGSFGLDELQLFEELKIPITCIKQVSGDDRLLSNYYKTAAFFVYPSLYEGFGIPPLEAMSHGCPVACSNTSSMPEVLGDAAMMFDPYSIESISAALEKIFFDSSSRSALIAKGFKRIQNFSWDKCACETLKVYKGASV